MENEFKPIPNFRKYAINKDGVIINVKTKRVLAQKKTKFNTHQVAMRSDRGDYTSRTPAILVKEIFG